MSAKREVAIGLSCYAAYLAVRKAVWSDSGRRRARANAATVVAVEQRLGLRFEPAVQRVALRSRRLVDGLNVGYAVGNVALSVGWLIGLYRSRHARFGPERRAAVIAFAGALPVFLAFPTAPPRSRDDHVDTLLDRGIDIDHPLLVRFYNPIAAMPSHHVAFAVVTGFGMAGTSSRPWVRRGWRVYPVGVATVVVATGNHYVLDVMAGAALGAVARVATR